MAPTAHARQQGLTLVELLVTIAILALLSVLSWRALDSMFRTRELTGQHNGRWQAWQTAIAQWNADLDALQSPGKLASLDFDGGLLRLIRREAPRADGSGSGLQVVAWTLRSDPTHATPFWARWSSAPLQRQSDLVRAWDQAQQWGKSDQPDRDRRDIALAPAAQWQLFYHRGGVWSNPLSASGTETGNRNGLPDGIRLQITLPGAAPPSGQLTVDWVRPTLGGGKAS